MRRKVKRDSSTEGSLVGKDKEEGKRREMKSEIEQKKEL